jgi:hypothetical protein
MKALTIGQRYPAKLPARVTYSYRQGQHELVLVLEHPTVQEIEDVRRGRADFALAKVSEILFLLYRFGGSIQWSDCPFNIHVIPPAERVLPPESQRPEISALLSVVVVEAGSGIVRAVRKATLSPSFTTLLHRDIRKQFVQPFDPARCDRALDSVYRALTTDQLLAVAYARCSSG